MTFTTTSGYVIPIGKIQHASVYGTGLADSPLGHWFKKLSILYAFPKIVHFVASELTNERIQDMTAEQAADLYMPVVVLHREIERIIARSRSHWTRVFLGTWISTLERDSERLGDVAEALAWGSDPELRKSIDNGLAVLEQQPLQFS